MKNVIFIFFTYMDVLSTYMYTHHIFEISTEMKEGIGTPGRGLIDGSEPSCGFLDSNIGLLQEQQVLQTSEPSLQVTKKMKYGYTSVFV